MVATPREPTIGELNRKMKRLEMLVMALIASDGFGYSSDPDELFYLFRKYLRDFDGRREDRDFFSFLEHMLYESGKKGRGLQDLETNLQKKMHESQQETAHHLQRTEHKFLELSNKVELLDESQKVTSKELHQYLTYQYLGEDIKSINLDRFIPVRVYLSEEREEDVQNVSNAIDKLLTALGFEFSDDFPAEKGSWWKKWFAKSKEAVTQPEVTERLKKIERAVELQGLHKPQSEIDKAQAEAIATLIASVKDIPNVAIQAGSILLVKTSEGYESPCLQVRTLTIKELIYLENNQHLLCKPATVLQSLSHGANNKDLGVVNQ